MSDVEVIEAKESLLNIQLDDKDYEAMLLSYILRLVSFELAKRQLSAEIAEKENITQQDLDKLESAEAKLTEIINVIDGIIFTPCLINYLRKYHPDHLDDMISNKGKIITMLNREAKEAIEREVEQFGLGKGKMS